MKTTTGGDDFPAHEHVGDRESPDLCVWTRADGETCQFPLTDEGLRLRLDWMRQGEEERRWKVVNDLTEAIRLTVEYVGVDVLPPIEGWSWYDAMVRYAPEQAEILKAYYDSREGS